MLTKISSAQALNNIIFLDNMFVIEYLPYAPDNYVKVYLYGYSLALNNPSPDNEPDRMAKRLGIDSETVMEAYRYWEEQGLVAITGNPPNVEYLPVKSAAQKIRKFNKDKYATFNEQLHAMLPNRNILPNEYNEYYSLIESLHFETEAMLSVIAYCIRLKGEDIGYPYILTVARNLAADGIVTYDRVQEKLSEFDLYSKDLTSVLKTLGLKRAADHEDKRLFIKWTKSLSYKLETIIRIAKGVKRGGIQKLDALITKFYENHLYTIEEIQEYNDNRELLFSIAKQVTKIIGVYYEQLDYTVDTYITDWLKLGFAPDALPVIADYCYKNTIRSLEGMNAEINKFHKLGILSGESVMRFIDENSAFDQQIKSLLAIAGAERGVNKIDRESYKTWVRDWKTPLELIDYAASLSKLKSNPISYMNSILSNWFNNNIRTLDDAKKSSGIGDKVKADTTVKRTYTADELNALFDTLEYEDI